MKKLIDDGRGSPAATLGCGLRYRPRLKPLSDEDIHIAHLLVDLDQRSFERIAVQYAGADADAFHAELFRYLFGQRRLSRLAADYGQIDPGCGQAPGESEPYHSEPASYHAIASFQVIKIVCHGYIVLLHFIISVNPKHGNVPYRAF